MCSSQSSIYHGWFPQIGHFNGVTSIFKTAPLTPACGSSHKPRFCARSPRSPPLAPNGREKCYTRSIWRPAMTSSDDVIVKDPQIMGGAPVFRGTRVPLQALFDYLEGGETLEEFLDGYPSVSREMAIRALEEAKQLLSARI